jgi:hypothetical protein
MASLLKRVLEEHPTSKGLKVMNLVYLRIVFNDKHSAAWFEKLAKLGTAELPLDLKYTLYAGASPACFLSRAFWQQPCVRYIENQLEVFCNQVLSFPEMAASASHLFSTFSRVWIRPLIHWSVLYPSRPQGLPVQRRRQPRQGL